ncbi:PIN domain nuclease [Streptomyces radicis]|uniref:Ribonuclease VapC n=1 Tax=Streptomyces radicis TaxID=1750517 RepID=A0A3A9W3Q0_9ACTN|nr:PIN domain nuclease [Streptomyces radicis]RKN07875.1 PIN domain nuclease [Streptomyces radicis]RKN20671.1 PIN domain nuclease [Streptomyces radicis]
MSSCLYLIDTSAVFRILQKQVRDDWSSALTAGIIAVCPAVELEVLYSARSLADRSKKRELLRALFAWVPMPEAAFERAQELQQTLTESGLHRSAGAIDLLVAATAEREGLIVLHDDRDYEAVSRVTGLPVKRVVHPD